MSRSRSQCSTTMLSARTGAGDKGVRGGEANAARPHGEVVALALHTHTQRVETPKKHTKNSSRRTIVVTLSAMSCPARISRL